MDLKSRTRKFLGGILVFFLASLIGLDSAQAQKNSGIGLVLINAIKRSGFSSGSNVAFSCASSLGRNGIYSISFRSSGDVDVYTRINERFICEKEDMERVLDRHACIRPAYEWGLNSAAELYRDFQPGDGRHVYGEIYHKGELTHIDGSLWSSLVDFFSWTTEAHADVGCEFGFKLKIKQHHEGSHEFPVVQEWDYDEIR